MIFNILIKKVDKEFIAHCLELDIVATGKTLIRVKKDITDLILTQVDYAFSNDNLGHLYRPAPADIWQEFYACKNQSEERINVKSSFRGEKAGMFIPPWIIARTCKAADPCHV
jgi:hypoxanthine phosphoribosyltransferase